MILFGKILIILGTMCAGLSALWYAIAGPITGFNPLWVAVWVMLCAIGCIVNALGTIIVELRALRAQSAGQSALTTL